MTDLWNAPAWVLEEPEQRREYVILDQAGQVLANVPRVPLQPQGGQGGGGGGGGGLPYANPHAQHDESRVVVRVADPSGTTLFFVDRIGTPADGTPDHVLVVAGDGQTMIGSLALATAGARSAFRIVRGGGFGGTGYAMRDAQGQEVGRATRQPTPPGTPELHFSLADGQGTEVGRLHATQSAYGERRRRWELQWGNWPQDPLRMLVMASPIAIELLTPIDIHR
ncbi:hypothetical protein J4573_44940 [Actinomadura barringtoniae]|uniref:Uncharacterized protein n=1 Tax=Actinomadura barringtoniae TaxID=1427535 RepID=A0A939T9I4_9ACTN|nr:hypothetical protein [Actinomadura barringtoniae]MBO2454299.1 hypothetical protein [Actinomadura barringtoniae]